jgi:hypothetical protein
MTSQTHGLTRSITFHYCTRINKLECMFREVRVLCEGLTDSLELCVRRRKGEEYSESE